MGHRALLPILHLSEFDLTPVLALDPPARLYEASKLGVRSQKFREQDFSNLRILQGENGQPFLSGRAGARLHPELVARGLLGRTQVDVVVAASVGEALQVDFDFRSNLLAAIFLRPVGVQKDVDDVLGADDAPELHVPELLEIAEPAVILGRDFYLHDTAFPHEPALDDLRLLAGSCSGLDSGLVKH